jgi:hypothetical protein
MGAAWGPFRDVLKVWDEYFARKPYKAHSMGIASAPPSAHRPALRQPGSSCSQGGLLQA